MSSNKFLKKKGHFWGQNIVRYPIVSREKNVSLKGDYDGGVGNADNDDDKDDLQNDEEIFDNDDDNGDLQNDEEIFDNDDGKDD